MGKRQADKSLKSRAWCPFWVFCFTLQARKVCKHSGAKSLNSRAARTFCVFCITLPARKVCKHSGAKLLNSRAAHTFWALCVALACIQSVRFPCGVDSLRHLHGFVGTQNFASKLSGSPAVWTICDTCMAFGIASPGRDIRSKSSSSRAACTVCDVLLGFSQALCRYTVWSAWLLLGLAPCSSCPWATSSQLHASCALVVLQAQRCVLHLSLGAEDGSQAHAFWTPSGGLPWFAPKVAHQPSRSEGSEQVPGPLPKAWEVEGASQASSQLHNCWCQGVRAVRSSVYPTTLVQAIPSQLCSHAFVAPATNPVA